MYEDENDHIEKYKKVETNCKNCDKFFGFLMRPVNEIFIGDFFCNLKCIDEFEKKQRKIKEGITEQTLNKGNKDVV